MNIFTTLSLPNYTCKIVFYRSNCVHRPGGLQKGIWKITDVIRAFFAPKRSASKACRSISCDPLLTLDEQSMLVNIFSYLQLCRHEYKTWNGSKSSVGKYCCCKGCVWYYPYYFGTSKYAEDVAWSNGRYCYDQWWKLYPPRGEFGSTYLRVIENIIVWVEINCLLIFILSFV